MEEVRAHAHKYKPKMIVAGFSSYPRNLDYKMFVQIAQEVDAIAFADMSHIGGLIAAGLIENPLDH
jgi:glycine hydroxymethyltransferase